MTFAELSGYLDRLESTSSRNDLVKTLAELYTKSSPDEIQPLTYLIQGRLVPFFEPVEIGLGEKLVIAAIAQAFTTANAEVAKLFGRLGDLGLVAAQLAGQTPSSSLPVTEVHARLMQIAVAAGAGSVEKKRRCSTRSTRPPPSTWCVWRSVACGSASAIPPFSMRCHSPKRAIARCGRCWKAHTTGCRTWA